MSVDHTKIATGRGRCTVVSIQLDRCWLCNISYVDSDPERLGLCLACAKDLRSR